ISCCSSVTRSALSSERKRYSVCVPERRLRSLVWTMPRQLPGVTWTTFITRQRSFWCWMIMPTRSCVAGINIGRNPPGGATERDHAFTTGDGETPPAPSRGLRLAEPVRGPGEDEPILGREGAIGIRNLVPVTALRVALDGEHGHAVAGAAVDLPQRAPDPARRGAD